MNGSNSTLIEYERFFRDFEQALENAKDVELQKADAYSDTTALFFSVGGHFKTGHIWALQNQPLYENNLGLLLLS